MIKPYITTTKQPRNKQDSNISIFSIYCNQYVLNVQLSVWIPQKPAPGGRVKYRVDDPDTNNHKHALWFELYHNNNTIKPTHAWWITEHEDIDLLREDFLDWFNRLQSVSNTTIDMILAMSKAQKWFNAWKSELIIKDVIK